MDDEARASRVRRMLETADMEQAIESAWAQLCMDLGSAKDAGHDPNSMREGARRMILAIHSIANPPNQPSRYEGGKLNEV